MTLKGNMYTFCEIITRLIMKKMFFYLAEFEDEYATYRVEWDGVTVDDGVYNKQLIEPCRR